MSAFCHGFFNIPLFLFFSNRDNVFEVELHGSSKFHFKHISIKMTKEQKIEELLSRGVENIYPSRQRLEAVLASGKKLRIYNGIDPTGKLHIGHMVVFRKLRQFQDLGHEIIILFGDFTAAIGDPAGKPSTRRPLTNKEILSNARNYKKQIGKILDLKKSNIKFLRNGKWLNKLTPKDMLDLASRFTVARLLERDMFQERIKKGADIHVHEFLYPVFQAYDSVAMDVDMEIGGNDQTFNMMRGRDLMMAIKKKEKFVMALKLLTDSGGKKMGKTEGGAVNLDENPNEMFGKIMSWTDTLLERGLEILTDIPQGRIKEILKNPREAKAILAKEIVAVLRGRAAALKAEKEFNKVFREGGAPEDMPEVRIAEKSLAIIDLLVAAKLAPSKAQAKRLVEQGGVKIDRIVKNDWRELIEIKRGQILQVGKKKFVKVS